MAMDNHKICFITCVNNEKFYEESLLYLKALNTVDMQVDFFAVCGADAMAEGYEYAMQHSDAKYKIYLHQDFFLTKKNAIEIIIQLFQKNPDIGVLGLAGGKTLPASLCWNQSEVKYGCVAHALANEYTAVSEYGKIPGEYVSVEAVDGMFLATQYDIPWRYDILKGWHFYDISQCLEFQKYGYKVVVPAQEEPWGIHLCGIKELGKDFFHWQHICQAAYSWRKTMGV